jgi:hypothetical protein
MFKYSKKSLVAGPQAVVSPGFRTAAWPEFGYTVAPELKFKGPVRTRTSVFVTTAGFVGRGFSRAIKNCLIRRLYRLRKKS